jgi:hypothetical protein
LTTVTSANPEVATFVAGICASNWVSERYVVVRTDLFHWIVDAGMKFEPFSVRISAELPALTVDGLTDAREGAGFEVALIENSAKPEFPPPGDGFVTLTEADPALPTSTAVICACN